jgi:hypothetical protein
MRIEKQNIIKGLIFEMAFCGLFAGMLYGINIIIV